MTGSAELELSLRVGEIGDVARPLTEKRVRALTPIAERVLAQKLPTLSLLSVLVEALRAGRCPERGRAASRTLGPLLAAFIVLVALDVRAESSRRRLHAALRALEPVSLDALEDLLSAFPVARTLIEAERMHRAGLLTEDWSLALGDEADPSGKIPVRVHAPLRQDFAEA